MSWSLRHQTFVMKSSFSNDKPRTMKLQQWRVTIIPEIVYTYVYILRVVVVGFLFCSVFYLHENLWIANLSKTMCIHFVTRQSPHTVEHFWFIIVVHATFSCVDGYGCVVFWLLGMCYVMPHICDIRVIQHKDIHVRCNTETSTHTYISYKFFKYR